MLSRRDFLKLAALAGGGLAASAFLPPDPTEFLSDPQMLGRVARRSINAYLEPDSASQRTEKIPRDTLLPLLEQVVSPASPPHNPRWYRVEQGYVHSAFIQRVEGAHINPALLTVPESGLLAEVTVPFTQTQYKNKQGYWQKNYRLYFGSLHWITGLLQNPDGSTFYNLTDEWLRVAYSAPAEHFRPVNADELAPLSTGIPAGEKRIEVSLADQTLTAYEAGQVVLHTSVATGLKFMETPTGSFNINRKTPSKHMGNGGITGDIHAYELVGVPWVSFFHTNGVAFHGTYWHDNYGVPMSHGCVNMRTPEARWLFRWCSPVFDTVITDRKSWRVISPRDAPGTAVQVY